MMNIKKQIVLFLLVLLIVKPLYCEEPMTEEKLIEIIKRQNTTVEIYIMDTGVLTRFPYNEKFIRSNAYEAKYIFSNRRSKNILIITDLVLAAYKWPKEEHKNIRILIDILVDNELVYSIPISPDDSFIYKPLLEEIKEKLTNLNDSLIY